MKLAIGLPITETVPGECFGHHVAAIVDATKKYHDVITITPVGLSPHDYARVTIADQALAAGCDRLMFMDDDTITPRGGIQALMETMDERKAVAVSGFYLRRGNPYTPVWALEKDKNWYNLDCDGGVHEIHMTGLGCCLLDLKWLEENLPKPWFRMDQNHRCTIVTDDLVLFRGIRAQNGLILGNADVQCPHIGRREWILRETAPALRNAYESLSDKGIAKVMPPEPLPLDTTDLPKKE